MARSFSLSLFFPAYNEEENIAQSVNEAKKILAQITKTYEIIIVNDGSKDKTGQISAKIAKTDNHVRVVHHPINQGYGAAVWSGIQAARYDYVFFTDADLQFDLNELKKLVVFIPEYPIVIGYRAKRRDPSMRLVNAKGWNILNRTLFGLKVKDIDCAFKLMKRDLLINLPIQSRGAMMSAELLLRLQRQGVPIKEVPVTHLPRRRGSPTGAKPSVILRAFKELFQTYRGELGNVSQRQLIKFIIVGLINTLLDLFIYFAATRSNGSFTNSPLEAKAVSFILASVFGFVANRSWTFRRKKSVTILEISSYYATIFIALIINIASFSMLVHSFGIYDLIAVLMASALTLIWNFLISKYWIFVQKSNKYDRSVPSHQQR